MVDAGSPALLRAAVQHGGTQLPYQFESTPLQPRPESLSSSLKQETSPFPTQPCPRCPAAKGGSELPQPCCALPPRLSLYRLRWMGSGSQLGMFGKHSICLYVCMYMCICVYAYVFICISVYVYMCIHVRGMLFFRPPMLFFRPLVNFSTPIIIFSTTNVIFSTPNVIFSTPSFVFFDPLRVSGFPTHPLLLGILSFPRTHSF